MAELSKKTRHNFLKDMQVAATQLIRQSWSIVVQLAGARRASQVSVGLGSMTTKDDGSLRQHRTDGQHHHDRFRVDP